MEIVISFEKSFELTDFLTEEVQVQRIRRLS